MRIAIADDSMLIREGVARLLLDAGCDITATVDNAVSLIRAVRENQPDAVIVDVRMSPTYTNEGLQAAQQLRAEHPRLGVLVLSQYLESHYATQLLADAPEHLGYLLKDRVSDIAVLVDALNRVIRGECVIDPTIVTALLRRPRGPGPLDSLSTREREVLSLMAEGRSNIAIAAQLAVSPKTLEAHIRQILQKLNLPESTQDHRRVLAVLKYLQTTD
ncbi:MAG: response regulator transcription factor [Nakamurella sp.]